MFHRKRGKRRRLLGLGDGHERIYPRYLRRSLKSEALRLRDLEWGLGLLAALGEAYGFRILLLVAHVYNGERRLLARFDRVRSSKRALRQPLRSDSEWRRRLGRINQG